jgi:hypothetical protein
MKKTPLSLFFLAISLGTLCAQKITVTSPTAASHWCKGTSYTITWSKSGDMQATVAIRLRAAGSTEADPAALAIANGDPNDGSFSWTIPNSVAPGSYFIRVRTDDSTVIGDSPNFAIQECAAIQSIAVTQPSGGTWCLGTAQTISWTSSGVTGNVEVILRQSGAPAAPPVMAIAANTANDGTEGWTIPVSLSPGSYLVRVRSLNNPSAYGDSADFAIEAPITVHSPSAGETWWMGEGSEIRWQADSSAGSQVRIELLNSAGNQVIMTVASSAPNSGSYAWTVPSGLPEARYCLRVASVSVPGLSAMSGGFYIYLTHCGTLASLSASSGHLGDTVNLAGQWPVPRGKHCVVFVSNSGIVSVPIPIIWTADVIQVKVPSEEPGPHRVMVRCKCDSDRFSSNALEFMVLGQPTDFVIEAVKYARGGLLVKVVNTGNAHYGPFDLKLTIAELGYSRVTIFPATLFNERQEMNFTLALPPWPEGKDSLLCEVIFDSMNRVAETNELNNILYQKVVYGGVR